MEISNLPDKELKVTIIKMFTEEWMNMVKTSTKELENIKKKRPIRAEEYNK